MPFKGLENYPVVKCAEGEKILCVQRQHPIVLINQSVLSFVIIILIPVCLLLFGYSITDPFFEVFKNPVLILHILLGSVALFFVLENYIFLSWYYHFYVVTNKALVEKFSFRISGPYSEVVMGEKLHVQEIIRKPLNLFYDFLRVNDVYIYFHKLEKEEPFVFRSPQDSQQIEDLIEDLSAKSGQGGSSINFQNGSN